MTLNLAPRLYLAQRCAVCDRLRDEDVRNESLATAVLFGQANPYVFCPACLCETDGDVRTDPEYQRRARVSMFERYGAVVRNGTVLVRGER